MPPNEATCFSILTNTGSLDLQTNSQLERDSVVSCLGVILDDVHAGGEHDWRSLHDANSPAPSSVGNIGSEVDSNGTHSDFYVV